MSKLRVILDAGHGGINPTTGQYVTSGKRSLKPVDGAVYYEGVGNRVFAQVWAKVLEAAGYDVQYTVDPTEWKDIPLSTRARRVNELHAQKPSVLVSIHSNAAHSNLASGHEVFTSPGITVSDTLAKYWVQEFEKGFPTKYFDIRMRKDMRDGFPDKEAAFTMLTRTNCPAILIELLFHTNDAEVRLLRSKTFQEKTANALLRAIKEFEKWSLQQ